MSQRTQFNSPFLLGFDQIERVLDRVSKGADGYPPYNIEQVSEIHLRIVLAVAGFVEEDLSVTLEDNQLVIRGSQTDDEARTYLHRGIAARQFQRAFVLADGMEVTGANLENGLLSVDLERPIPEPKVRKIDITPSKNNGKAGQEIELTAEEADV